MNKSCLLRFYETGKTQMSSNSNIKLKVSLPFVPQDKCKKIYGIQGKTLIDNQVSQ